MGNQLNFFKNAFGALDIQSVQNNLRTNGWSIFPERVPQTVVDDLRASIDELTA